MDSPHYRIPPLLHAKLPTVQARLFPLPCRKMIPEYPPRITTVSASRIPPQRFRKEAESPPCSLATDSAACPSGYQRAVILDAEKRGFRRTPLAQMPKDPPGRPPLFRPHRVESLNNAYDSPTSSCASFRLRVSSGTPSEAQPCALSPSCNPGPEHFSAL